MGAADASWEKGMLEDCMLGTQGGWLQPPSDRKNNTNLCPLDIYTRPPAKASPHDIEIGCWFDNATAGAVANTDDHDRWLCSNPLNGTASIILDRFPPHFPSSTQTPCTSCDVSTWASDVDWGVRSDVVSELGPTSGPCSAETPCLWDVDGDVSERHEVAAENPAVVAQMVERLRVLSAQFEVDPPLQGSNDDFCAHVQARGGFLGPWMP